MGNLKAFRITLDEKQVVKDIIKMNKNKVKFTEMRAKLTPMSYSDIAEKHNTSKQAIFHVASKHAAKIYRAGKPRKSKGESDTVLPTNTKE